MTPVKVCGLTREEDALLAASLGAWAVGFIFYENSPRYVNAKRVAAIVKKLPSNVLTVGVFVNASATRIREIVETSGIQRVQLHGDESPAIASELPVPFFRAVRPKSVADIDALSAWPKAEHLLVDAAVDGLYGGTGQVSNWQLAIRARAYGTLILSGGLKPENVEDAIRKVGPFAVDVSSGLEERVGVKDAGKLKRFFEAVRKASKA